MLKTKHAFLASGLSLALTPTSRRNRCPRKLRATPGHEQHAALDTTFVQFYPTLIELAKKKSTLSANYLKDEAATAKK